MDTAARQREIYSRMAENRQKAELAMGWLVVPTAPLPPGPPLGVQQQPPLPPPQTPAATRPALLGALSMVRHQSPIVNRIASFAPLGQGNAVHRPPLPGTSQAAAAAAAATAAAAASAAAAATAAALVLKGEQIPLLSTQQLPGDALLQADGTTHVPPGPSRAAQRADPGAYSPYSYRAPGLGPQQQRDHQPMAQVQQQPRTAPQWAAQNQPSRFAQQAQQPMTFSPYGPFFGQESPFGVPGNFPFPEMALQGLGGSQGSGTHQPICLPPLPIYAQGEDVQDACWHAANVCPELPADRVPGVFGLAQTGEILTVQKPREGEEWMTLNPRQDEQQWRVHNCTMAVLAPLPLPQSRTTL
jgi:hypothetical protein